MKSFASALVIAFMTISNVVAAEAEQIDGSTIIVTGTRDGYRTVDTTSGTKTRTPIINVPQTIDVVTEAQIKDQAIRSVADLVRMIPGISAGQGEGHRDQITLRGNNSTADFFVDGLRDDAQYFRSFYNIDRVEVHKGPNAMVFGRGGGGGIVNRISKGAILGKNAASFTGSIDSFGSWYSAVDSNIAFDDTLALRLNGFYEELNNHRDAFGGSRLGINPVLGSEFGIVKTQIGYEYIHDDRVVDRGIPSAFAGTIANPAPPLSGYRDTFFGAAGANIGKTDAHMVRLRTEAALSDSLTLSFQGLYSNTDKIYSNAYAGGPVTSGQVRIDAYRDITKRDNVIGQGNLEWRGKTGGIDHVVLIGGELTKQDTLSERVNPVFPGTVAFITVPLTAKPAIPTPAYTNRIRQISGQLDQVSFYIQDQITLSDHWQVIAGLRYDALTNDLTSVFNNQRMRRTDHLWSPRAGVIYKPVPQASIYMSWAKSYLPQSGDQFVGFDVQYAALAPETFDNYELGAKWNIAPALTAAAAIYRLDRGNTRASPTPGTFVLTGGQRTEGFELSLTGKLSPQWQTAMAYARTTAHITSTTTAATAGRTIGQVPRDQLSLWNRYDITSGVGLGLGLIHQSSQFTSINNIVRLPGFTRVDGALFVKLPYGLEAQVNIENLFNTTYFPAAHSDNNISTGAPRNARLTINAKF